MYTCVYIYILFVYIYECVRLMISTFRLRMCSRYSGRKVWLAALENTLGSRGMATSWIRIFYYIRDVFIYKSL